MQTILTQTDYVREAECQRRMRRLLENEGFSALFTVLFHTDAFVTCPTEGVFVPDVVDELSTKRVLTSEFIYGTPIDLMADADQKTRNMVSLPRY